MVVSAIRGWRPFMYCPTRSSSRNLRRSRSFMMAAAVKLLECEAIRNRWRGGQLFAGIEIGASESVFGDQVAAIGDRDDAAGLLNALQLKFQPVGDVVHRVFQPWLHIRTNDVRAKIRGKMLEVFGRRSGVFENSAGMLCPDVIRQNKTGATPELRRFDRLRYDWSGMTYLRIVIPHFSGSCSGVSLDQ